MPYIPFTDEQKVLANSVDLEQFLRMRGEKLERVGREHKLIYYDSSGKHDSITIHGSTWFDHKNQIGGGAIKFMQEFYDMDFQTAVRELLGQTVTPLSHSPPKVSAKEEKKEFRLPKPNSNMHRVYAYLIKQRFIAAEVITHFAKQHTLYEDKDHHNAVFVGLDENGVPRQAHKRSTSTFGNSFRQTIEGSDTRYSFAHFGESGKLFVFEAPIDMMSFLTLYPKGWQKHSYIAMNGVYENAVLTALKNHSNLTEIVLCVDNDEGGIDAAFRLKDVLMENGYTDVKRLIPEYKDWNEVLKAKRGAEPLPAVPHYRMNMFMNISESLKFHSIHSKNISKLISNAFDKKNYVELAECSVSAAAVLSQKACKQQSFEKLCHSLKDNYLPYRDKGSSKAVYTALCRQLFNLKDLLSKPAMTENELFTVQNTLLEIAEKAVRLHITEIQESESEELSQDNEEDISLSYG